MGDLKKKKSENTRPVAGDDELRIETDELSRDEQVIARLRGYIEKFYAQQEKKINKEEAAQDAKKE